METETEPVLLSPDAMTQGGSPASGTPQKGTRLLPKLVSIAIRHVDLVVLACCAVGFITLLLLPALAKYTYISENALIPGSANPKFILQDAMDASRIAMELQTLQKNEEDGGLTVRNFLVKRLAAMDAEFYLQPFMRPRISFTPMSFVSSQYSSTKFLRGMDAQNTLNVSEELGVNVVGIVRAPRGEGNEAIVLVTPFNSKSLSEADAFSLGLGLSLLDLLKKAQWLAKDIIWLAADSQFGSYDAVVAWLTDYYEPSLNVLESQVTSYDLLYNAMDEISDSFHKKKIMGDFKRAGVIAAGMIFELQIAHGRGLTDSVKVYAEGSNGQMPNLDLINVVNNLAVYREGIHMKLDVLESALEWTWLQMIGRFLEKLGQIAAMVNAGWRFSPPASEYVQAAATLSQSLAVQALGVPTGAHGAFRDYQIDAVTLLMLSATHENVVHIGSLIKFGRLLEGTIRSVNNLLEKFHQSFFLYFLTGPNRFISVGVYIIPLLLLLISLPLKAAAMCSKENDSCFKGPSGSQDESLEELSSTPPQSGALSLVIWSLAAFIVCCVEIGLLFIAMSPAMIAYAVESPKYRAGIWLAFCIISTMMLIGILMYGRRLFGNHHDWMAVKAATLGAATIGIGIMSLINFAAALVGAVILVPMCLIVYPLKLKEQKPRGHSFVRATLVLLFTLVGFLPVMYLTMSGSSTFSVLAVWEWVERMWKWGSATYLYLFLVHFPCFILCLHILSS